mmetsp:Transcript_32268/g.53323  ORF Transcript_32268/g.53323 Transcript_32268/m.53323 type:complete len:344 (+) Transcript_32268:94-1125(+)|eukprot:CAMPEP_0119313942 /NCGR_PEP_ID=MMETSP1333-20130426/30980_1 /TAXON_ID=418940 /ORGANISM="Scyphosphaera apsteinii, Strain RCC1455" /LENGTH=343 /DNA_ID=CAMNT_0007318931 /DNA_START=94 /DNA_END=1125 /DNA_ORIENTATION=+
MGQAGSREEGSFTQQAGSAGAITGFSQPGPSTSGTTPTADVPREDSVVPTVLQWSQGGQSVYVTGSFNAWGERIPMRRSGNECVVCLNLLPGTYQYKFIVDNEWKFAPDQPTVRDEMGNINNCVTVEDQSLFMREEPMSGFFNDNAPNLYTQALPDEITLAKEPPQAPLHLCCLPQNLPLVPEPQVAAWSLQPPLSVTLTHLTMLRSSPMITLAVTHRFRHKFVTVVIYKPRLPSSADEEVDGCDTDAAADAGSRMPAQTTREGRVRARASTHSPGGKRPSQMNWTDVNATCGLDGSCLFGTQFAQQDTASMPPPPPIMLPSPGAQPMDLGSRPASQSAMEVG